MTPGYPEPADDGQHRHGYPETADFGPTGDPEYGAHAAEAAANEEAGALWQAPPAQQDPQQQPVGDQRQPQQGDAAQAPTDKGLSPVQPADAAPTTSQPHPAQQTQAMRPASPPQQPYQDPNMGGYPPPPVPYGPPPGAYPPPGAHPNAASGAQQFDPAAGYGEPDPGYAVPNPPGPSPYATQGAGPGVAPDDLGRQTQQAAHDLSSAKLLKSAKREPQSGWRRAVYVASGRSVNLGESAADVRRRELITRVNQPLRGCYKIAMLSLKGGVGKTTATTTLGSTFSSLRGDRVIAVDANPDRGTLSQKIPLETTATVRHLLRDANRITRYSDIRSYTSQGPSRLEVLASEQDPAVSEAFSESDYRRTIDLLEHFYNIVLTDCGTGLMHSAMKGVLEIADSLIIVSSGSIDGARSASATLDWLDAHGYRDLVGRSVAVINSVRPKSGKVQLERLQQHFAARCRTVCQIPFDPHLEEGAEIELERLDEDTRLALLELAASVADDFPQDGNRR